MSHRNNVSCLACPQFLRPLFVTVYKASCHGAWDQWPIGLRVRRSKERPPRATVALIRALCLPRHLCLHLVLYVSIAGTRQHQSFFVPAASAVCVRCRRGGGRGATARAPLSVWPTGGVGSASAQGVANLAQAVVGRHDAISWAANGRLRRERRPCSIAALEINSTQRDTHEVGVVGAPIVCIRGVRVTVCSIADFPTTVTQTHQGR
jgi:hypothetical protein